MAHTGPVHRWELYTADLDPTVGREQAGDRPVLVLSNDGFNRTFDVVTVLPLTKQAGKRRTAYPFEVLLPAGRAGNALASIVMPHQIRTISKARLLTRLGVLSDVEYRREIEDRVLDHLGISFDEESLVDTGAPERP